MKRITAALQRLDVGKYGRCAACGVEIGEKRLDMDPLAALGVACAS